MKQVKIKTWRAERKIKIPVGFAGIKEHMQQISTFRIKNAQTPSS